jgi:hypothetical protein
MANSFIFDRLAGIQGVLNSVHAAGGPMSASTRGQERQAFISSFLSNVLPPTFRFGSGDATDAGGHRSGQLDVVVEFPFSPSLPSVGGEPTTRLYLAESVAAVVEVKSNVSNQWDEAQRTAALLFPLRRTFQAYSAFGNAPTDNIPLFVAGYKGWKTVEKVREKLAENPDIAGILVIDPGIFVSSSEYGGIQAIGPWSLWALITALHRITNGLQSALIDPIDYA